MATTLTGYPYLACARRYGVDYGTLLAYADARRKELIEASDPRVGHVPFDCWEVRAIRVLSRNRLLHLIDRDVDLLMRRTLADKGAVLG